MTNYLCAGSLTTQGDSEAGYLRWYFQKHRAKGRGEKIARRDIPLVTLSTVLHPAVSARVKAQTHDTCSSVPGLRCHRSVTYGDTSCKCSVFPRKLQTMACSLSPSILHFQDPFSGASIYQTKEDCVLASCDYI